VFQDSLPGDEPSETGREGHPIHQRTHESGSNNPAFSECEAVALEGIQAMMSDEKPMVCPRKIVGSVRDRGLKSERPHLV
jgi:hypothetical protein